MLPSRRKTDYLNTIGPEPTANQEALKKIERRNWVYRMIEIALLSFILSAVLVLLFTSTNAVNQHREQTEHSIHEHRRHNQEDHDRILKLICDIIQGGSPERITQKQREACLGVRER